MFDGYIGSLGLQLASPKKKKKKTYKQQKQFNALLSTNFVNPCEF